MNVKHILLILGLMTFFHLASSQVNGGFITFSSGDTTRIDCQPMASKDVVDIILTGQSGENSAWLISTPQGDITDIPTSPPFDLKKYPLDSLIIYHLAYSQISNLNTGSNTDSLSGDFSLSNGLLSVRKSLTAGSFDIVRPNDLDFCRGDGIPDTVWFDWSGTNGAFSSIVITSILGDILQVSIDSFIDFDTIRDAELLIYHLSYEAGLNGLQIGENIMELDGCFGLSQALNFATPVVSGGSITLPDGRTELSICVGDNQGDSFTPELSGEIGEQFRWVISDSMGTILAVVSFNTFNLEGVDPGRCRIHHIAYIDAVENLQSGFHLDSLRGCFSLSNPIIVTRSTGETSGGQLSLLSNPTYCNGDGKADTTTVHIEGHLGDQTRFLLVDDTGRIIGQFDSTSFDLEGLGLGLSNLSLIAVSFQKGIGRLADGHYLEDLEGCFSLSNAVPLDPVFVRGGHIAFPPEFDAVICSGDGIPDSITVDLSGNIGLFSSWVIADQTDTIRTQGVGLLVDLDAGLPDTSFLYFISHDSLLGSLANKHLSDIPSCHALSNRFPVINATGPVFAPALLASGNTTLCMLPHQLDSLQLSFEGIPLGAQFRFAVFAEDGSLISLTDTTSIPFSTFPAGNYTVYLLALGTQTEILPDFKALSDIRGCYDVSPPLHFSIARASGGTLSSIPSSGHVFCINDGVADELTFSITGDEGQASLYVVTDTNDVVVDAFTNNKLTVLPHFPSPFVVRNAAFSGPVEGLKIGEPLSEATGCIDYSNSLVYYTENLPHPRFLSASPTDTISICPEIDSLKVGWQTSDTASAIFVIHNRDGDVLEVLTDTCFFPNTYNEYIIFVSHFVRQDSMVAIPTNLNNLPACSLLSDTLTVIRASLPNTLIVLNEIQNGANYRCLFYDDEDRIRPKFLILPSAKYFAFILVNTAGEILSVKDSFQFTNTLKTDSLFLYFLNSHDTINVGPGDHFADIDPCIGRSNAFLLVREYIDRGIIAYPDQTVSKKICSSEPPFDVFINGFDSLPPELIVTTTDSVIVRVQVETLIHPDSLGLGEFLIWAVSTNDAILVGDTLRNMQGCIYLSPPLTLGIDRVFDQMPVITVEKDSVFCEEALFRSLDFEATDSVSTWLVTGEDGKIAFLFDASPFILPQDQRYGVVALRYGIRPDGLAIGNAADEVQGCFAHSDTLFFDPLQPDAGRLSFQDLSTEKFICGIGDQTDTLDLLSDASLSTGGIFILTNENDIILGTQTSNRIILDNLGPLRCKIWYLAYFDEKHIPTPGEHIGNIGGCFSLSNPVTVTKSRIAGGVLKINGEDSLHLCLGDLNNEVIQYKITGAIGNQNAWITTSTDGLITGISLTPPNNFNAFSEDTCLLRHIRYLAPQTQGLVVGHFISDISGCFDFSNAVSVTKSVVNGGSLLAFDSLKIVEVCVDDGEEEDIKPTSSNFTGQDSTWLITDGIGRILEVDVLPPFSFEGESPGQIFIWKVAFAGKLEGLLPGQFLADISGCYSLSSPLRILLQSGEDCLVPTLEIINNIRIRPNPFTDEVEVELPDAGPAQFMIFHPSGVLVKEINSLSRQLHRLELGELAEGIYFMKIISGSAVSTVPIYKRWR